MPRIRPAWVALACIGLWFVQLVFTGLVFRGLWPVSSQDLRTWEVGVVGASVVLGGLLLGQLPRALQWRPRRHPRPSAEVKAERQRIARDLHDHLGSQLLCAMALLEGSAGQSAAVRQALQKCVLDLRLIVDSMDGDTEPLPDRLARLRYRLQPALSQSGIRMVWNVLPSSPAPGGSPLPPDKAAHVVAIVQEALSNVLQHSDATRVCVSVHRCGSGTLHVTVTDNGRGMSPMALHADAGRAGKGVQGMRVRAQMAGGTLSITPAHDGGTCVHASVPVSPQTWGVGAD